MVLGLVAAPAVLAAQQGYDPTKDAVVINAESPATLTAAIIQAAEVAGTPKKPVFHIGSYRSDSGFVRMYEEHLLVDTLERGYDYAYCSTSYQAGFNRACSEVTVEHHLAKVDDRGMVTTWRMVRFTQDKPGEFRVTFERFEPTSNGYARAVTNERDLFFDATRASLKKQGRSYGAGSFGPSGVDAKGLGESEKRAAAASDGPTGVYQLVTVNDQPLPFPMVPFGSIAKGEYVLEGDGSFHSLISSNIAAFDSKGKYSITNGMVTFSGGKAMDGRPGLIVGRIAHDTLTYSMSGQRMRFVKQQ